MPNEVAPRIHELQALATTVLRSIAIVQKPANLKIRDSAIADSDVEDGFSCVVSQDGTKHKIIKDRLRHIGFCIVVEPIVGGTPRAQSGPATLFDSLLAVEITVNHEQNNHPSEGAMVNALEATAAVISALCRNARHPGGEFFKIHGDGFTRSSFDDGVLSYIAAFTKEAVL